MQSKTLLKNYNTHTRIRLQSLCIRSSHKLIMFFLKKYEHNDADIEMFTPASVTSG